ncbi:putative dehydrogenase [SAR116 cluster alpha proteobacterium HIMB100]|nr:putative dehydrogenase [SAR116 cluster alpha proteobacterium HIMB100]
MTIPSGRTVLITGGVSGLGLAMATAFAANGAQLYVGGHISDSEAADILDQLRTAGAAACTFDNADLRDATAARAMADKAEQMMGSVDILINNAGIQHVASVEDFPPEKWQDILDVNLSAPFHLTAAVLPGMKARDFGRIVNISSAHGVVASVKKAAYVAAKHGLVGLTKTIALEVSAQNITCNAICPGFVLTPLVDQQVRTHAEKTGLPYDEAGAAMVSEKHPSGQFMTPEQIADMALFLARDEARNITGSSFSLDGGWTAQ